jgi:hypothetical protein
MDSETRTVMLSLNVLVDDELLALKIWELIGRAAAGIAFEGVQVSTSIVPTSDGDDD